MALNDESIEFAYLEVVLLVDEFALYVAELLRFEFKYGFKQIKVFVFYEKALKAFI